MDEQIDGVRVLRHREPQEHTDATLTFAVGARDETLPTVGVAHALEHLVMHTVRHLPISMDAEVNLTTTRFVASGSPGRVGEFLNGVCAALAAPPVERLPIEAKVLATEDGWAVHPLAALLLHVRYGAQGPGLSWLEGPGYDGLTAEHVTSFARTWFTPANALLQVTGPVPANLRLELPAGPAPRRTVVRPRVLGERPAVAFGAPAGGVLLTMPPDDAARLQDLAIGVLRRRVEEQCRHSGGHSYEVGALPTPAADGATDWVVFAEARDGSEREVARTVAAALTDLAEHGPSAAELAHAVAAFEEELATIDVELQQTFLGIMGRLVGDPDLVPLDRSRLAELRPADVAAVLRDALPTAIGYGCEDAVEEWKAFGFTPRPLCAVVPDLPAGRVFRPSLVARTFFRDARRLTLVRTDDGLALRDEDGVHEIRWDEIAGVMRTDGATVVLGRNGCTIPIAGDVFRGADALLTELTSRTDRSLWFDESELTADPA